MTYLDADAAQEYRNSARRIAQMALIQYEALKDSGLPEPLARDLMVIWWTETMRPQLPEFPDFTKLFGTPE